MFLVDTNVLLDIFTDDATWRSWSERAVRDALLAGVVGINPLVYAETEGLTLLTRDAGRYRSYFPSLKLVTPPASS